MTIKVFCLCYGGMSGLVQLLVIFNIAPNFVAKLGALGFIYLLVPSLIASLLYHYIRHYIYRPLVDITICQFNRTIIYLPLYVAQHNGFFKSEGLNVKIISGHGDDSTWEKVKCCQASFGISDPTIMLDEINNKGKVIASILSRVALWGITAKSIPPMKDMKELSGKTIAVYKSPSTSYMLLNKIISDNKLGRRITVKEINVGTEISALKDPNIDIVFVTEPIATLAEYNGGHRVISLSKYFGDMLFTGLFVTDKYINENPEIVQKVVNAFEKSLNHIHSNSVRTLESAITEFKDSPKYTVEYSVFKLLLEGIIPEDTTVHENSWTNCLHVRKPFNASSYNFSDYVDNSYALKAANNFSKSKPN